MSFEHWQKFVKDTARTLKQSESDSGGYGKNKPRKEGILIEETDRCRKTAKRKK